MHYINEEGVKQGEEVYADYVRFMLEHSHDIVSGRFFTRFDFGLPYVYILDVEMNELPKCAPEGYALLAARGDWAVAYWNGARKSLMTLTKSEGVDGSIYDAFSFNFMWQDCASEIEKFAGR